MEDRDHQRSTATISPRVSIVDHGYELKTESFFSQEKEVCYFYLHTVSPPFCLSLSSRDVSDHYIYIYNPAETVSNLDRYVYQPFTVCRSKKEIFVIFLRRLNTDSGDSWRCKENLTFFHE